MPNDSPLVSQYLEHISGTALDQYQKIIRGLVQRRSGVYPERFPAGLPHPPGPPVEVWINPPKTRATEETRGLAATRNDVQLATMSLTT